jgi:hypothetical protein
MYETRGHSHFPIWAVLIAFIWLIADQNNRLAFDIRATRNDLNALQIKVASDPAANDRKAMQREIDELELKVKDLRIEVDALKRNE